MPQVIFESHHISFPRRKVGQTMRLGCNATQRRSSLRLVVQNDAVFIVSFSEHGPWNLREGHGRLMTKGNAIGEECYHGRRVFVVTENEMIKDKTQ